MCVFLCKKLFINERSDMNVCGASAIFSAITMSDFKIAAEFIRKRKMTRYYAWMNALDIEREIDLSDISLDRVEVNF